jgi:hypothetical protein
MLKVEDGSDEKTSTTYWIALEHNRAGLRD